MSLVVNSWSYHPMIILLVVNTKVNIQNKCITIFKSNSIFSTHLISLHIAPMFHLKSICYTIILEKSLSHFQIQDLVQDLRPATSSCRWLKIPLFCLFFCFLLFFCCFFVLFFSSFFLFLKWYPVTLSIRFFFLEFSEVLNFFSLSFCIPFLSIPLKSAWMSDSCTFRKKSKSSCP